MSRCTGGPSPKGAERSGRMHLRGGEEECTKHRSDNFSFLSTISRAAAHNRPLLPPLPPLPALPAADEPGDDDDDEDDASETERAPSLPSTIPETIPRTPSPDLVADWVGSVRSESPDDDLEERIAAAIQRQSRPPTVFSIAVVFFVTITLYGYYRWLYRVDFHYQDGLIRESFGLERSGACWF